MRNPSPRFLATWPPQRATALAAAAWYCARTSRQSSGSSCCASGVEPTRSQKRTVNWRRSPGRATSGAGDGSPGGRGADSPSPTGVPHSGQNFALAGTSTWQRGQRSARGAPHSRQNRARAGFSWPQEEQGIASRLAPLPTTPHGGRTNRRALPHRSSRRASAEPGSVSQSGRPGSGASGGERGALRGSRTPIHTF